MNLLKRVFYFLFLLVVSFNDVNSVFCGSNCWNDIRKAMDLCGNQYFIKQKFFETCYCCNTIVTATPDQNTQGSSI